MFPILRGTNCNEYRYVSCDSMDWITGNENDASRQENLCVLSLLRLDMEGVHSAHACINIIRGNEIRTI